MDLKKIAEKIWGKTLSEGQDDDVKNIKTYYGVNIIKQEGDNFKFISDHKKKYGFISGSPDSKKDYSSVHLGGGTELIADCHMHIMSGACSPLTIIWDKNFALDYLKPRRTAMDVLGGTLLRYIAMKWIKGDMGVYSKYTTTKNTKKSIEFNKNTYEENIFKKDREPLLSLYTPMVAMSLDMGFAHYYGYYGYRSYIEKNDFLNNEVANNYLKELAYNTEIISENERKN